MNFNKNLLFAAIIILAAGCSDDGDCTSDQSLDSSGGSCSETLTVSQQYSETSSGGNRVILANAIPVHAVGLFGSISGALNPNAIAEQNLTYTITSSPTETGNLVSLLGTSGPDYSFGILFNGVELDPIAAEPFPHGYRNDPNANWEWNLEALNVQIGLDCNNAHVQPNGKYHYHGVPSLFIQDLNPSSSEMTLIGYAADGFPIYYKYAYTDASDTTSAVIEMTSSYSMKSGDRPGDGDTAPCDAYNGVYSADYEYMAGSGTLDEANGRFGVTPGFPSGTFYYVITEAFPSIPRYFRGTPSNDFAI
ncbi:MAG: hypothetical protein ACI85F_001799 [Bacteroidia bacterium]|jgi:hypothetical protein